MDNANLSALLAKGGTGPLWGAESEDLDCTFLAWGEGQGVAAHRNSEVDVLMVVLSGHGQAVIDGQVTEIKEGTVLLIPKDAERSIQAVGSRLAYLNVHKRRRKLMPGNPANRPRPSRLSPFA